MQIRQLSLSYLKNLSCFDVERETGFGPATFALARQRSTTEPLPHTADTAYSLKII